jgi:cupin superfamily acireductone dioxygenase involved in methionine salvage
MLCTWNKQKRTELEERYLEEIKHVDHELRKLVNGSY